MHKLKLHFVILHTVVITYIINKLIITLNVSIYHIALGVILTGNPLS